MPLVRAVLVGLSILLAGCGEEVKDDKLKIDKETYEKLSKKMYKGKGGTNDKILNKMGYTREDWQKASALYAVPDWQKKEIEEMLKKGTKK